MANPQASRKPEPTVDAPLRMAEALMAAAGFLVEARDSGTVAQRVVDEVRELFHAKGALLCRLDVPTRALEAIAVSGEVGPEYGAHMIFAPGMGTPGLAATTLNWVITRNVLKDPRIALSPETRLAIEHAPFRAVLAVPLVLNGIVNGTLCILDREGRKFTEQEGRFAQAFAHQAALAFENARLNEVASAATADAVAANRAKDDFLAVLSHELRAPLTSIYGWARMLRAGQMDKHDIGRALAAIEQNSLLQTQLINDLLDVSRIVAGRLEITPRPVALLPTIMGAVESLRNDAEDKGVKLTMASEAYDCTVAGDPLRLHQIMTNLIGNAIKFTPRGGSVELRICRQGPNAHITVRDTGRGITPDVLPFIFERFGRGKRTAGRGEGGLGLGLSIVRHLVDLHGGRVTAESAGEGRGATFVVVLPLTDEVIEPPHGRLQDDATGATLRGRAVLVVEDDQDTRELVALVLRDEGATVAEAGSIAEAVATLAGSLPDVLISDFTLPDGDGVELIDKLRTIERTGGRARIAAIALTGLGDDSERRRAMSAGYDVYLLKPFDPIELVDMVTKALGRST